MRRALSAACSLYLYPLPPARRRVAAGILLRGPALRGAPPLRGGWSAGGGARAEGRGPAIAAQCCAVRRDGGAARNASVVLVGS